MASTPQITQFIQENPGISADQIIKHFGLNASGVFRHLKKLQIEGLIYKVGKPPKVRYYTFYKNMSTPQNLQTAINWATSGDVQWVTSDQFCQTRDVFQARTDHLLSDLKRIVKNENLVFLLVAAVGEIGNNSFDHNIGNWRDVPGVFFALDPSSRSIIIADRGQGIFATIKKVRPDVKNSEEAAKIAFTEMVSGRAPEKRGNGLKFVRKIIEENQLSLEFITGDAEVRITKNGLGIKKSELNIPGTLAYITF